MQLSRETNFRLTKNEQINKNGKFQNLTEVNGQASFRAFDIQYSSPFLIKMLIIYAHNKSLVQL